MNEPTGLSDPALSTVPLRGRPGFASTALLTASLTVADLFRRKRLIFIFILLCLPALIIGVAKHLGESYEDGFLTISPVVFFMLLAPLLSLFHATGLFTDEVENQTISYLLLRPVSRDALLTGKLVGAWLTTWILLAFSATAAWAIACLGYSWTDLFLDARRSDLLGFVLLLGVSTALYTALHSLIGLVVKHATLVCILHMVIVEIAFSLAPGPPARLAISAQMLSIVPDRYVTPQELIAQEGPLGALYESDRLQTLAGAAVALGLLLTMNILVLRRSDFSSGGAD